MEDFYVVNYKTLLIEIKEVINKWRVISYPLMRKLSIVKMSISSKLIYKFNAISTIILGVFFICVKIQKLILKFT